ncbi:hypothetical protein F2P81_002526 [Scophthalmus maximus]|uniref:Uncharacterized protein n=1 Tax=Scophthalmus maximus TaxID=52904 RepID=A0A6A4TH11_SCOMX|nr:hypothetical protein F2P81_002526 [Scophthalmus maximus]
MSHHSTVYRSLTVALTTAHKSLSVTGTSSFNIISAVNSDLRTPTHMLSSTVQLRERFAWIDHVQHDLDPADCKADERFLLLDKRCGAVRLARTGDSASLSVGITSVHHCNTATPVFDADPGRADVRRPPPVAEQGPGGTRSCSPRSLSEVLTGGLTSLTGLNEM